MSGSLILAGVLIPLLVLSTTFVALRFYCQRFIVRRIGLDDWIMLIALINVWAIAVTNVIQTKFGSGTHNKKFSVDTFTTLLKSWYAFRIEYFVALFFVKMSILAFYRRLSPATWFQLAIKIVAVFVAAFTLSSVLFIAFICPKNPKTAWAPTFPKGCLNINPFTYAQAAINIATDVVIYVLPLPSILSLPLCRSDRVAAVLLFSVGSVAVIASIVRLVSLTNYPKAKDKSYESMLVLLWSSVELNVAIVCASAPAIRPLLTRLSGGDEAYGHGASSDPGVPAKKSHNALKTSGVSTRSLEPGSNSAASGTAASEKGDGIEMGGGEVGGSVGEVVSPDIKMGRTGIVGGGQSEGSKDLEPGR